MMTLQLTLTACSGPTPDSCGVGGGFSQVNLTWTDMVASDSTVAFYSVEMFDSNRVSTEPAALPAWTQPAEAGLFTPPTPKDLSNVEGSYVALFVPAAFVDQDGDGAPSNNETFVAISEVWLLYIEGIDCQKLRGLSDGWNTVTVDLIDGAILSVNATGEVSFTEPLTDGALSPFSVTNEDASYDRAAVIPEIWADLETTSPLLIDQETGGGDYTIALPEWPIDQHLQPSDINGEQHSDWFYSVELFATYLDADQSNDLTNDDQITGGLCLDGAPLAAVNTPNPDTINEALYLAGEGLAGGWSLWQELDSGWVAVELTAESVVTSGAGCVPPSPLQ